MVCGAPPPIGHYGDVPYDDANAAPEPGDPLLGSTPVGPPEGFPSGPQPGMPGPYGTPGGPQAAMGFGAPGAPTGPDGPGAYGTQGGPDGPGGAGPDGPGNAGSKKRKVLIAALAGAGAVVVLAGAAFFAFGRGPDETRAANGTPRAQTDSRQTAETGARHDEVGGQGSSKAGQQQQTEKGRPAAGQKERGHRTSDPRTSATPSRKTGARPPAPRVNKYTPRQACGSGYRVLASHALSLRGTRVATVYLLYSGSSGDNCVVTMRSDQGVGRTKHGVRATVQARGGSAKTDGGAYLWYAGPVRVHAPGKCVRFGGTFTTGATVSWTSPYGHCG